MGADETDTDLREEIRDIVAAILEVDIERIGPTTHF